MGYHGPLAYWSSITLTGLIAFFLFMIPGVEFLEQILSGLITDLDDFILSFSGMVPVVDVSRLLFLGEAGVEVALFNTYPLHWILSYRPDDAWTVALQIIPWLASGAIIGGLFPENPKDALIIGFGTILSSVVNNILLFVVIPMAVLPLIPMMGPALVGILNGMATGFTDLPMGFASILAVLEGGAIFTAMLVFMSTLKNNERPAPESTGGARAALVMTTLFGSILCIPGLIVGIVNAAKNPGDRKALDAVIIGGMQVVIFIIIVTAFVPGL